MARRLAARSSASSSTARDRRRSRGGTPSLAVDAGCEQREQAGPAASPRMAAVGGAASLLRLLSHLRPSAARAIVSSPPVLHVLRRSVKQPLLPRVYPSHAALASSPSLPSAAHPVSAGRRFPGGLHVPNLRKRGGGTRSWIRVEATVASVQTLEIDKVTMMRRFEATTPSVQTLEIEKVTMMRRCEIPARDLRLLDLLFVLPVKGSPRRSMVRTDKTSHPMVRRVGNSSRVQDCRMILSPLSMVMWIFIRKSCFFHRNFLQREKMSRPLIGFGILGILTSFKEQQRHGLKTLVKFGKSFQKRLEAGRGTAYNGLTCDLLLFWFCVLPMWLLLIVLITVA